MRIKLLMIMILPLLLIECQTSIWTVLSRKDSKLYSEVEKIMLHETTLSVDFKYGYDPDLEIDYVYKAGTFTDKEIIAKSQDMKKVLLKYNSKQIISFYEKIFQLKETQIWKMNYFREKKNWVNSTFIQKYTLAEAELFHDILEKNVIQINAEYNEKIVKRKNEIKKFVSIKLLKEIENEKRRLREQRKPSWK